MSTCRDQRHEPVTAAAADGRPTGVRHDVGMRQTDLDDLDSAPVDRLTTAGVQLVLGTMVNAAGLTLAKSAPVARVLDFARSGMGSAPVWDVFAVDGAIAFTDRISAVGDRRLRIDLDALRVLPGFDGGERARAWAPTDLYEQDGSRASTCSRGSLRGLEDRLAAAGLGAMIGHELEFVLVEPDGSALPVPSAVPYGLTALLDRGAWLEDLVGLAADAGIALEQVHAEYGPNQFELSLPPAAPVAAADAVVATKIIIGLAARRHGLRASFSPSPFPGLVGNGAHQHLSLRRGGTALFGTGGSEGPYGMSTDGAAAIGGLLAGLPEIQGILGGSILSGARLAPGAWAGATRCWGRENREAALRYLDAGPANPHGANVEVKIVDGSANPYLASAAILALALDGIERGVSLPPEVPDDPSKLDAAELTARGIETLPTDPAVVIDALDASTRVRAMLGDDLVDASVAVRRHEQQSYADASADDRASALRLTWSI